MANMSYCRFENTYNDLLECYEAMGDGDLSKSEQKFRDKLIALCESIAEEFGDDSDDSVYPVSISI